MPVAQGCNKLGLSDSHLLVTEDHASCLREQESNAPYGYGYTIQWHPATQHLMSGASLLDFIRSNRVGVTDSELFRLLGLPVPAPLLALEKEAEREAAGGAKKRKKPLPVRARLLPVISCLKCVHYPKTSVACRRVPPAWLFDRFILRFLQNATLLARESGKSFLILKIYWGVRSSCSAKAIGGFKNAVSRY